MDYRLEARNDAQEMVQHFIDEILEQLIEEGKASDDLLNDYPNGDAYHHERHVDKCYSLLEAATLLSELENFEESDSGLWEGLSPREAIKAQAAYTYGNAVYHYWNELIEEINLSIDIEEAIEKYNLSEGAANKTLAKLRVNDLILTCARG